MVGFSNAHWKTVAVVCGQHDASFPVGVMCICLQRAACTYCSCIDRPETTALAVLSCNFSVVCDASQRVHWWYVGLCNILGHWHSILSVMSAAGRHFAQNHKYDHQSGTSRHIWCNATPLGMFLNMSCPCLGIASVYRLQQVATLHQPLVINIATPN